MFRAFDQLWLDHGQRFVQIDLMQPPHRRIKCQYFDAPDVMRSILARHELQRPRNVCACRLFVPTLAFLS